MGVCGASLLAMLLWQLAGVIPIVRDIPQDRTGESNNKLYRGTSRTSEIMAWSATGGAETGCGLIMSDAARNGFFETNDIDFGLQQSRANYESHLNQIGSLDDYIREHALRGTEFTEEYGGERALISLTSLLERAVYFSQGGLVLEVNFDEALAIGARPQTLSTSNEGEWLVPHMIRMCQVSS